MKIRATNLQAPRQFFAPCGYCEECRNMNRSAWEFRFRAEVEELCVKGDWQMCFFTLTYNNENMPYLPPHVYKDYDEFTCSSLDYQLHPVPCFSKTDIRDFIHGIRKHFHKKYGVKRLVYLICAEHGSHTHRPHYHGSILFPPCISPQEMFNAVQDMWTATENEIKQPRKRIGSESVIVADKARRNKGFICPRTLEGYEREKPFLVPTEQAVNAAVYTAKYVSKDIYYMESLPYDLLKTRIDDKSYIGVNENDELDREQLPHLREYLPFHLQTRQLGLSVLSNATDSQKVDLYFKGYCFVGKDKPQCIPVYLKNKILFNPFYIVDSDGKRHVCREATEFFNQNYKEIFKKKVGFYAELVKKLSTTDYYIGVGRSNNEADEWSKEVKKCLEFFGSPLDFARNYLLYYGVRQSRCYDVRQFNDDYALVWLNHFASNDFLVDTDPMVISEEWWFTLQEYCSRILYIFSCCAKRYKTAEDRLIDEVADYHKSAPLDAFDCGYIGDNNYVA